jgi:predicted lactoylglutathione lyase
LPVKDLDRSKEFFGKPEFTFNLQFTDARAACMAIPEGIHAMGSLKSSLTKKLLTAAGRRKCRPVYHSIVKKE